MTARHDLRCNEARWARPIGRHVVKAQLVRAAVGQEPALARRLASSCRIAASRSEHAATQTALEHLQRMHLEDMADLQAAAGVLELLS